MRNVNSAESISFHPLSVNRFEAVTGVTRLDASLWALNLLIFSQIRWSSKCQTIHRFSSLEFEFEECDEECEEDDEECNEDDGECDGECDDEECDDEECDEWDEDDEEWWVWWRVMCDEHDECDEACDEDDEWQSK